jgi:hypothetical protein
MRKILVALLLCAGVAQAQTVYDSSTLVDTNNTSVSTSTVSTTNSSSSTSSNTSDSTVNSTSTNTNTNVNTNNNINSGTQTLNNNNVNTGTMTYNNNNVNSGTLTYNNNNASTSASTAVNTNNNINSGTLTYNNNNVSASTAVNQNTSTAVNQNVQTGDMTNRNINDTNITQRVIQPPPTAIAPTMMSGGNADLCSTGTSGSVQTQIFGVSGGGTVRDLNCERLKLSKTLFDMGMKVAAVATMCQDRRVFDAMMAAGTPCPYEGKIGETARASWEANPSKLPKPDEVKTDDTYKKLGIGALLGAIIFKAF